MRQNTDDLWKTMDMTNVDEFKSFHLVIETRINQQQNLAVTVIHVLKNYTILYQSLTK